MTAVRASRAARHGGPAAAILVTAAMLVPGAASARIVVNRSIAGVKLGEDAAAVHRQLGSPSSQSCVSPAQGSARCGAKQLRYRSRKLAVTLIHGRVASLSTRSTHERTKKGVGPGVKVSAAEAAYRHGTFVGGAGAPSYFLGQQPKHRGDRYSFFDYSETFTPDPNPPTDGRRGGGTTKPNRVTSLTVGSYDPKYVCVLFACAG